MKLPKIFARIKLPKLAFLKKYGEFIVYIAVLLGLGFWQWRLYSEALRPYQDLLLTAAGLELLNLILALIILPKARLLAQFFIISAIIFGGVTIYYLSVALSNVV
jgi:hypothetical protein